MCKCGNESVVGQRYCLACHAAYMREWRKTHKLTDEARRRDIARHYLAVYVKRGIVTKECCAVCGTSDKIESHHADYDKPLEVSWLCRKHHLEMHRPTVDGM